MDQKPCLMFNTDSTKAETLHKTIKLKNKTKTKTKQYDNIPAPLLYNQLNNIKARIQVKWGTVEYPNPFLLGAQTYLEGAQH